MNERGSGYSKKSATDVFTKIDGILWIAICEAYLFVLHTIFKRQHPSTRTRANEPYILYKLEQTEAFSMYIIFYRSSQKNGLRQRVTLTSMRDGNRIHNG